MAKKQKSTTKSTTNKLVTFIAWLTGVIVSLSVGFALIDGLLTLPTWLGGAIQVDVAAGWIVVLTTLLGVILAIVGKFK